MKVRPRAAIAGLLLLSACSPAPSDETDRRDGDEPESVGEASSPRVSPDGHREAPDLSLPSVDGTMRVSLTEQRGKVVLVDLWATWCVPCIAELPHLQTLSESYSSDDFMLLGIVLESGETQEVADFLESKELAYPQVMGEDSDRDAFGRFLGYPTKYLIDRDGWIVKRYFGIVGEQLADDVETLIQTGSLQATSG